ncbi:MAG: ABC transporter, partial [Verrucomicrobiota bacterium]
FIQPFISAYWSWSGIVRSLEPRYFTAVDTVTDASLQGTTLCLAVLAAHLFVGIIIAFIGAGRARWNH